ncbi:hypothetical protein OAG68_00430 [bacterium]|nr:hypothetical protein [bacterium]
MKRLQFSIKRLLLLAAVVACVIGFSVNRVQTSRKGRIATYQIWGLDGQTAGLTSKVFVAPISGINSISLTCHHGFWNDLTGFDHTAAIFLPESEYNLPIDFEWIQRFETAVGAMPRLKVVWVERQDINDETLHHLSIKFTKIRFERALKK